MLETIRNLPSASSITPTFDHMAVDTSWERKVLKKVTWLQMPGEYFVGVGMGSWFLTHDQPVPSPPMPPPRPLLNLQQCKLINCVLNTELTKV